MNASEYAVSVSTSVVAAAIVGGGLWLFRRHVARAWSWMRTTARLYRVIDSVRMQTFIRSRADYALFKPHHRTIGTYIERATKELTVVSITLVTGIQFNGFVRTLRDLLEAPREVRVRVSLLSPWESSAMDALSRGLEMSSTNLAQNIQLALRHLLEFRDTLSTNARQRLMISVHTALPFASAILIDPHERHGTIQCETKPYKSPLGDSWGFELQKGGSSGFYNTLVASYDALVRDGEIIDERHHRYQSLREVKNA